MGTDLLDRLHTGYAGVLACVLVGTTAAIWMAHKDGVRWPRVVVGGVLLSAAALAGARVYYLLAAGLPLDTWATMRFGGGYRAPGALLGFAVGLPFVSRFLAPERSVWAVADVTAFAFAAALPVWRVGCWMLGCCFGEPTSLPWGVEGAIGSPVWRFHVDQGWIASWSDRSLPTHPLPIYLGALSLGVALLLAFRRSRRRYPGQLVLVFLVVHEGGKALLEAFRQQVSPDTAWLQLASLSVAAVGIVGLGWMHARSTMEHADAARFGGRAC